MTEQYDAIIIEAGLGGLTAGAKLAKEGKKVLLIEQHYIVGGCATVFKRKDFTFEVGLHELDGLHEQDLKTKIFRELGVFDNVEFIKLPEFYRFKNDRIDIVIPHGTEEAIKVLTKHFPEEEKGIKKYFRTINSLREEVYSFPSNRMKQLLMLPLSPFLFPSLLTAQYSSIGGFLDKIIKNSELKLLLLANLLYYHDDPYKLSLLYFAGAQSGYYQSSYYIKGGSQKLKEVKRLVSNLEKHMIIM